MTPKVANMLPVGLQRMKKQKTVVKRILRGGALHPAFEPAYPRNIAQLFSKMSCENCGQRFTIIRKKRLCLKCGRFFCGRCLLVRPGTQGCSSLLAHQRERNPACRKCLMLFLRPLCRYQVQLLGTIDLQCYLRTHRISVDGCIEKDDLIQLFLQHASSSGLGGSQLSGSPIMCDSNVCLSNDTRIPEDSHSVGFGAYSTSSTQSSPTVQDDNRQPSSSRSSNASAYTHTRDHQDAGISCNSHPVEPSGIAVSGRISLNDIKTLEDIDKLSVKQMKELLLLNRVDFKGCCEKKELMERIKRLWLDKFQSEQDVEKMNPIDICKICMDARIECVLLECGHMATCMVCGKQLNECPICRQFVVRAIRAFRV